MGQVGKIGRLRRSDGVRPAPLRPGRPANAVRPGESLHRDRGRWPIRRGSARRGWCPGRVV